ncbi:YpbF family protein [Thermolongibacillus altinsuensis]|uniref:YpbF family protein n=1 Tax=Thermolongibacillus altinsuensis TaxID=575256 RepID=UPI00242A316A|nr:YpbF family protein [Thermolongibacillus altinsuensis]GMB07835.1 hypothetical protein B1no1_05450 [Thermolongibacillus altinsuensis]
MVTIFPIEIDEVTKQMLLHLIERKKEWDELETKQKWMKWCAILVFVAFASYLYVAIIRPSQGTIDRMISLFLDNSFHLYMLMFVFSIYWGSSFYKKKCEKAEQEFHALRCEMIQKSTDLFRTEDAWNARHLLFAWMKNEHDINLYYENK